MTHAPYRVVSGAHGSSRGPGATQIISPRTHIDLCFNTPTPYAQVLKGHAVGHVQPRSFARTRIDLCINTHHPCPCPQVLKGHAAGQVHEMMEGLLRATARKVEEEGGTQGRGQAAFGRQVAAVVVGGRA